APRNVAGPRVAAAVVLEGVRPRARPRQLQEPAVAVPPVRPLPARGTPAAYPVATQVVFVRDDVPPLLLADELPGGVIRPLDGTRAVARLHEDAANIVLAGDADPVMAQDL